MIIIISCFFIKKKAKKKNGVDLPSPPTRPLLIALCKIKTKKKNKLIKTKTEKINIENLKIF